MHRKNSRSNIKIIPKQTDIRNSPSGLVGINSSVRVFALKFSPVPSIQTYMAWQTPSGIGRSMYLVSILLFRAAFGECSNVGFGILPCETKQSYVTRFTPQRMTGNWTFVLLWCNIKTNRCLTTLMRYCSNCRGGSYQFDGI